MTHTPATTDAVLGFISARYPRAELTADDDIFSVGYVNSLFAMELVMFLENTFGVVVPNDELRIDNFRTATAMTQLVARISAHPLSGVGS
ncbi:acyl carrier protein [Nocardioides sp. GXZ039]|uniref:acyl carrier protein n=1 Tax=Nocardioides sp. GXZ039 TaxID=3136018 RepID=UPI0030F3E475